MRLSRRAACSAWSRIVGLAGCHVPWAEKEKARWASGQIVRNGDLLYINNDRGELVIVKPEPGGYREVSRTFLIKPTTPPGNRRELEHVNWSHPAYANRRIYTRNNEKIIAVSLAGDGK